MPLHAANYSKMVLPPEQARERISNLSQLLEVAKTRYQELGGILDEKDEESITKADEEDEGFVYTCLCRCLSMLVCYFLYACMHMCVLLIVVLLLHNREIARLKTMLELEREKREELEREADELRHKLHQASVTLLRRQLSSEVNNTMLSSSLILSTYCVYTVTVGTANDAQ